MTLVSLIIPARNEAGNIPRVEAELSSLCSTMPYDFEFIVIDNCSTDDTGGLVKAICERDKRWKYIRFSRDFTVEMSITAGYHHAKGDVMIVLYSDLQDPPAVIPEFLKKWQEGYDVVYGVRTVRPGDPAWRNLAAKIAYRLIRFLSDVPIPNDAGDYRLITRRVRDELERMGEYNRYMRGMITWLGFRQIGVPYERQPRLTGKSNAPFWSIFFFAFSAITSFSLKPLRLFTFLGLGLLFVTTALIALYTILAMIGNPPPGITTLITLSLFGIGLNSFGIGILGEYVGRTYSEVKQRPLYVIDERYGFDDQIRA